jgi:hypothetical protein
LALVGALVVLVGGALTVVEGASDANSFVGTVVADNDYDTVVPGATISVTDATGLDLEAVSDANGYFAIYLPSGAKIVDLTIEATGYQTYFAHVSKSDRRRWGSLFPIVPVP